MTGDNFLNNYLNRGGGGQWCGTRAFCCTLDIIELHTSAG